MFLVYERVRIAFLQTLKWKRICWAFLRLATKKLFSKINTSRILKLRIFFFFFCQSHKKTHKTEKKRRHIVSGSFSKVKEKIATWLYSSYESIAYFSDALCSYLRFVSDSFTDPHCGSEGQKWRNSVASGHHSGLQTNEDVAFQVAP